MASLYFDYNKYKEMMKTQPFSDDLKRYFLNFNKKYDGRRVDFPVGSEIGFLYKGKEIMYRDWCSKKKNKFEIWTEKIGNRIRNFQEV